MPLQGQVSLFPDKEVSISQTTPPPAKKKETTAREEPCDDIQDNAKHIRFIHNKDGGWRINNTTMPSSVAVMRDNYEIGIIMKSGVWKYFIRRFRASNGIAFEYSSQPLCVAKSLDEMKKQVIALYK